MAFSRQELMEHESKDHRFESLHWQGFANGEYLFKTTHDYNWVVHLVPNGGRHSTEVAFALLTQQPRV